MDAVAAARTILTPEETFIPIRPLGFETRALKTGVHPIEGDLHFQMPTADTLVLFEFLCREIDERDGANLLGAFVSPAEFWALNNLQCVLEKGDFYSVLRDYQPQLDDARSLIMKRKSP